MCGNFLRFLISGDLDLWPFNWWKLALHLLVPWTTSFWFFYVFFLFEIRARTEQTDRQTDGRARRVMQAMGRPHNKGDFRWSSSQRRQGYSMLSNSSCSRFLDRYITDTVEDLCAWIHCRISMHLVYFFLIRESETATVPQKGVLLSLITKGPV